MLCGQKVPLTITTPLKIEGYPLFNVAILKLIELNKENANTEKYKLLFKSFRSIIKL